MKKIKNFVKEYLKHIVFVIMTSATISFFGWIGYSIKSSFEKYTSVPAKVAMMMEIHKKDSIKADEFIKHDSQRQWFFVQQLDSIKNSIHKIERYNTLQEFNIKKRHH